MIREIRREDYANVARFWRELLNVPTATDQSVSRTLEKMSEDDHYCTFVAVEDGMVVGFITLVEVLSMDDPNGYIKMNGIAILPQYQRRGIGHQLIERAELEARRRGADSIGCASSFGRVGSQSLLAKMGYEQSAYWYHKVLSDDNDD